VVRSSFKRFFWIVLTFQLIFRKSTFKQINIDEEKDGVVKIWFSKDKIGWIKKTDAKKYIFTLKERKDHDPC